MTFVHFMYFFFCMMGQVIIGASQVALVVKNLPVNARDIRGVVWSLGWEDPLAEGHGNPLQHSCLENPMDRGAWQATVHRVARSWTLLKRLSMHTRKLYLQNFMIYCFFFFFWWGKVWLLFELSQIIFLKNISYYKQTYVVLSNETSAQVSQSIFVIPKYHK